MKKMLERLGVVIPSTILTLLMAVDVQPDVGCQQALRGIPAGEVVARVAHQEGELLVAPFILQLHRSGKFA